MSTRSEWSVPVAVGVAALALCSITAAVTLAGTDSDYAALEAVVRALTVGVPIAVGLYALLYPPFARFGKLLIAVGFGWFLTTLSGSPDELLYSIGRVSGWIAELALVYVVLAFPTGRLTRPDRILVAAAAVVVAVLYLPTAFLVESFPAPSPSCPASTTARATRSCWSAPSRDSWRTSSARCARS